jgi:hypothetical protein
MLISNGDDTVNVSAAVTARLDGRYVLVRTSVWDVEVRRLKRGN